MTSCCFESEFQQLKTSCEFGAYTCRQCSGQMPHSVMVSHGKSHLMNGFKGCIYVCAFTVFLFSSNQFYIFSMSFLSSANAFHMPERFLIISYSISVVSREVVKLFFTYKVESIIPGIKNCSTQPTGSPHRYFQPTFNETLQCHHQSSMD